MASQRGQVPLNLDNRGLWYQIQMPFGMAAPASVIGMRNGVPITLGLYDDYMPVPTGLEFDSSRADPLILNNSAKTFTFTVFTVPKRVLVFFRP